MKQIALAFPMGVSHLERVAYGIGRFSREMKDWQLITNPEKHILEIKHLANWHGEGIIGFINNPEEAALIQKLGIPTVNISGAMEKSPIPRVRVDYFKIGESGGQHLLSRGVKNFAYYGIKKLWYADEIGRGFAASIQSSGFKVNRLDAESTLNGTWSGGGEELAKWLKNLEKPVGILAAHDPRALEILQTCQREDIKVPQEVALLGINNDGITCELAHPTLSSIPRDGEQIGYKAAELLHQLMLGENVANQDVIISPLKVVERESTAYFSLQDESLSLAVNYVRENCDKFMTVDSLSQYIRRSRRWIEYAFQKELKTTPSRFINEMKVKKAIELLNQNNQLKLSSLASMAGFSTAEQMNKMFRQIYGKTVKDFRKN